MGAYGNTMEASQSPAAQAAVDNDGGATNIFGNSAQLRGNLLSTGGASTVIGFFWGTNDGSNVRSNWQQAIAAPQGSNWSAGPYSYDVTALQETTTYFYVFYATNSFGEAWALPATNFTTPLVDGDTDGIDDEWEFDNFGSSSNIDGTGDFDADGLTDYDEFIAGT